MKKIALIREGKTPPDSRTALTPAQCKLLSERDDLEIVVQRSAVRIFEDSEYEAAGVPLTNNTEDADIMLGIKEVPIDQLIPNKKYLFFSHTTKKQAYNRELLKAILAKRIQLIDYELLTDSNTGSRIIAFGFFAGMVGAHNALWTWGERTGDFQLKRLHKCRDYSEAVKQYKKTKWPSIKIVVTGNGRVGSGAVKVLRDMGIREVSPEAYLSQTFDKAVFTQLAPEHYVENATDGSYDREEFYSSPEQYSSIFEPYTEMSDIFINGIYWHPDGPAFFDLKSVKSDDFSIQVIADVTCDIAPITSIPTTLYASTIADPVFGYDPISKQAVAAYTTKLDMMTIDNLPNELPRDASKAFGNQLINHVLDALLEEEHPLIERATIAKDGKLTENYAYLQDFVDGKE